MKKVIPKKKNPFYEKDPISTSSFLSSCMGVAGENVKTGDLLVVNKDGKIVRFTGSEGRENV